MSAVAKRYARAAVDVAEQRGGIPAIEALAQGLRTFGDAYNVSPELREVLRNPALRGERTAALSVLTQKLGLSAEVGRLVLLLARRNRFDELSALAAESQAAADARMGRARAYVSSAIALTAAQEQRLARALEKRFGQPVALSITVDPSVIGGLICRVGDLTMDSSIRRQLELLREKLLV